MRTRNVFYSWQTDSDESCNRSFIEDCLKRAIRKLNREDLSDLIIDRDTRNVPGMPDIGHTILEKIAKSSVVVADLTIINPTAIRRPDERPVSNPNVLFELGYAFGKLGATSMVGVFNTTSGDVEELPFDLRPKRLMTYRLETGDVKAEVRTKLVDALAVAIKQCLGDTEEEQVSRNSQIHRILAEIWLFGTEIEEWYGIERLPIVIQNHVTTTQKLSDLMAQSNYADGIRNVAGTLVDDLIDANTLALTEDNWPIIKQHISSAGSMAAFIHRQLGYKIDQEYRDELVVKARAMPTELSSHIQSLLDGQFRRADLEKLAHELRMMAFVSLIPQHPQFSTGLNEISLQLRYRVLGWAKNAPKKDEAITAIQDIRERLSQLIAEYSPTPIPSTESTS